MISTDRRRRVTFVRGVMQRCGTNYVYDLLRAHPSVSVVEPIWEDHVVNHLGLIDRYVERVSTGWNPSWGVEGLASSLAREIGDGICRFLDERAAGDTSHVLTKSPHARDLRHAMTVLPDEAFVLIVRDGRDTVESAVRSFGWRYETAIRVWADGAAEILRFLDAAAGRGVRHRLVRYEDVLRDPRAELERLFETLELDGSLYPFDAIERLPVRGSSDLKTSGQERIHWDAVPKSQAFNPIGRWSGWSDALCDRFDWVAGDALEALGYERSRPARGWTSRTRNVCADAGSAARGWLKRRIEPRGGSVR